MELLVAWRNRPVDIVLLMWYNGYMRLRNWVVWIDQVGKWHAGCTGLLGAEFSASELLTYSWHYVRHPEHRPTQVWALEAPNRYQAIKVAKQHYLVV